MVNRETPAAKAVEAADPQREPGDICALVTERTFLTQEEMVLAQTGLCCLLLPQKRKSHVIHQASLEMAHYVSNKPSNKKQDRRLTLA